MDRGAWRARVHGVTKGSDMTEPLSKEYTYQALTGQLSGSFSRLPIYILVQPEKLARYDVGEHLVFAL